MSHPIDKYYAKMSVRASERGYDFLFDRCLSLEEKSVLAQLVINNEVRKPNLHITVMELSNLNPLHELDHIYKITEDLHRRGYITKETPQ